MRNTAPTGTTSASWRSIELPNATASALGARNSTALVSEGTIGTERITLLKPETYMNDSGRAVGDAQRFLKIPLSDVYVFHDELDLAPGKVKVKAGGGNAGHNGLRSISAHIENDYKRVRLGIGHPGSKDVVIYYVLNDFAKSERAWLTALLDAVADAAPYLAKGEDDALPERHRAPDARANRTDDPAKRKAAPDAEDRSGAAKKPAATATPVRRTVSKRQSALAENLKKWLGARKSGDDGS